MNEDIIRVDSYDYYEKLSVPRAMLFLYYHLDYQSRTMEEVIDEIASEYSDSISVFAADIEQSPDIAYSFGVTSTPCVLFFIDGEVADAVEGANPKEIYLDIINEIIE